VDEEPMSEGRKRSRVDRPCPLCEIRALVLAEPPGAERTDEMIRRIEALKATLVRVVDEMSEVLRGEG